MTKSQKLRELFNADQVVKCIGAHDGLTAKIGEQCGFDALWASGLEISTSHALPDANILTMSEYLERAIEMTNATSIPVVADCDTGYGNANNVIHMVQRYEAAGIAGVCIEDKLFPKVNSYVPGRQELAPIAEFVGKIMAAKHAQASEDFMVIARVEALIAGWGQEEALKRAHEYVDAGADAILMHSKAKTSAEIEEFCTKWNKRAPLVVVPTAYPDFNVKDMKQHGINMVIYANHGLRASIKAMTKVYEEILKSGKLSTINNDIVSMQEVFELQGMNKMKEKEGIYVRKQRGDIIAVIPAAGEHAHVESMKNLLEECPVAMLDINGKSILKHNVEILSRLNITDIRVTRGFKAELFNVDDVKYVDNADYKNSSQADSIMLAMEESVGKSSLVIFSDVLFNQTIIERLTESKGDVVVAMDSNVEDIVESNDYIEAENAPIGSRRKILSQKTNKIKNISKKLDPSQINYEFTGIAYFSKKGTEKFKAAYEQLKQDKGSVDYLEVIQKLIDQGVDVVGLEVDGNWIEIRDYNNYKVAHSIF